MPSYAGSAGQTAHFRIQKHQLPASHIREYPRATKDDQEALFHLAVKQYTPLERRGNAEGGVTIIGAHANAFPKELYEPLWDDLYESLQRQGVCIGSIWTADVSHQGDSSVLNEHIQGNDPSWFDASRDLFLMVNHFREHMKRPIVGIGHSMGGHNLVQLSLMHPRLFAALVLIDPVIQRIISPDANVRPAQASTVRRDRWPSRPDAAAAFKKSRVFQTWDPRVLAKWVEHGLRELPTALYPEPAAPSSDPLPAASAAPPTGSAPPHQPTAREVTLKTTKHQEVATFLRPNLPTPAYPDPETAPNPHTHPDIPWWTAPRSPFYRPEPLVTFTRLPHLRPSVLYIFGDRSDLSAPPLKADKLAHTGVGWGGSGGVARGRVAEHTFPRLGHLIPMQAARETADVAAPWIARELSRWRAVEADERREWDRVPSGEKSVLSRAVESVLMTDWMEKKKKEAQAPRKGGSKL